MNEPSVRAGEYNARSSKIWEGVAMRWKMCGECEGEGACCENSEVEVKVWKE